MRNKFVMTPERKVSIAADSSAILPKDIIDKYNIGIIPFNVTIDDGKGLQTLRDGVDIDMETFVEMQKEQKEKKLKITTSAPLGEEYIRVYKRFSPGEILSIHLGKFSATIDGAIKYAESVKNCKNTVYNSGTAFTGMFVLKAAILAEQGKSISEITSELDDLKRRFTLLATFNSLYYLKAGGRISDLEHWVGGILNLKPILEVRNDVIAPKKRERSINKAIELVESITLSLEPEEICILHGGDEEYKRKADEIAEHIINKTDNKIPISICYAGIALATHAGPEAIGMATVSKKEIPEKIIFESN